MADSFDPGSDEEKLAAPFKLKGVRAHRRFVRVEKDPQTGLDVNVYELEDDDEFPVNCRPVDERGNPI